LRKAWIICLFLLLALPGIECIFAQDAPKDTSHNPKYWIDEANKYIISGEYEKGIADYNKAIELDLENMDVGTKRNDYREADKVYNAQNQSKNKEAWYGKGLFFELHENYPEANRSFYEATRIDEFYKDAWKHMGIVRTYMEDEVGAFCAFHAAYMISNMIGSEPDPYLISKVEGDENAATYITPLCEEGPVPTAEKPSINCAISAEEKTSRACQK
jgi:tetratricopeptide (TPR) repeat protein